MKWKNDGVLEDWGTENTQLDDGHLERSRVAPVSAQAYGDARRPTLMFQAGSSSPASASVNASSAIRPPAASAQHRHGKPGRVSRSCLRRAEGAKNRTGRRDGGGGGQQLPAYPDGVILAEKGDSPAGDFHRSEKAGSCTYKSISI